MAAPTAPPAGPGAADRAVDVLAANVEAPAPSIGEGASGVHGGHPQAEGQPADVGGAVNPMEQDQQQEQQQEQQQGSASGDKEKKKKGKKKQKKKKRKPFYSDELTQAVQAASWKNAVRSGCGCGCAGDCVAQGQMSCPCLTRTIVPCFFSPQCCSVAFMISLRSCRVVVCLLVALH